MKRQSYYPSRIGDQINWLENLIEKLPLLGPGLGLDSATIATTTGELKWLKYVMNSWLTAVRAFAPASTAAMDTLMTGTSDGPFALPVFTVPAAPAGVGPAPAGVLTRVFNLIAILKRSPHYNSPIGLDLQVEGTEDTSTAPFPRFTLQSQTGLAGGIVRIAFSIFRHMGVYIESRRGTGTDWEFIAIDTESPYEDARPLLDPKQPETREYRMRFWDKGLPNGDWTPIDKATVAP